MSRDSGQSNSDENACEEAAPFFALSILVARARRKSGRLHGNFVVCLDRLAVMILVLLLIFGANTQTAKRPVSMGQEAGPPRLQADRPARCWQNVLCRCAGSALGYLCLNQVSEEALCAFHEHKFVGKAGFQK